MASCKPFKVKVRDVKKAVKQVNDAVKKAGGTFKGDEKGGSYKVADSHWIAGKFTIEGEYTVKDTEISISNKLTAEKPDMVTCDKVEEKVREWLK